MQSQEETIMALRELARSYAASIDKLTMEIAATSEDIKSALLADEAYKEIDLQIKALQKQRKIIKEEAMARQGVIDKQQKLKELRKERKEKRVDLSDYLIELQNQSGLEQLELFDGKKYIIKKSATLVRPTREMRIKEEDNQLGLQFDVSPGINI